MRHEDFASLSLDDVMGKTLAYCRSVTDARAVHWISEHGLANVRDAAVAGTDDVMGQHVLSLPGAEIAALFRAWHQTAKLLTPALKSLAPQMIETEDKQPRLIYPVSLDGRLLGVLAFDQPRETNPVALIAQFRAGLEIATKYISFAYQHLSARAETYLDELTGLYNQRYLPLALDHEIARARRDRQEFTLLFLDIDFFKQVNDGRGHWVGSRLLVELGKVLRLQVRACDYCFRYGGDEFIVLLGGAGADAAVGVAERIRRAVESKNFEVEGHQIKLTVSIGLAAYPTHAESASSLIQIADHAMYNGKRKSRNIVFVAS